MDQSGEAKSTGNVNERRQQTQAEPWAIDNQHFLKERDFLHEGDQDTEPSGGRLGGNLLTEYSWELCVLAVNRITNQRSYRLRRPKTACQKLAGERTCLLREHSQNGTIDKIPSGEHHKGKDYIYKSCGACFHFKRCSCGIKRCSCENRRL